MELNFLLVADCANVSVNQKLNVMGIFDAINSASFPMTHPEMYVVLRLAASPAEYGRAFKLGLKLIDEDAANVPVNLSLDVVVPMPSQRGGHINLQPILRLSNVAFATPGTYQFSVLVDGDEKGSLPLEVRQFQPASNS